MLIVKKIIDYVFNRSSGIYHGYLSPKTPKILSVPLFVEIGNEIKSIPELINYNLQKISFDFKFKKPLIISDKNTWEIAGKKIYSGFKNSESILIKSNKIEEVCRIINKSMKWNFFDQNIAINDNEKLIPRKLFFGLKRRDIIIAVGGGSVIDTAKLAAYKLNLPLISIPTSLSNDGFASPFSVINLKKNCTKTLEVNVPLGVILDISLIKSKDNNYKRRIRSGIADLISNITAVYDWELAFKKGYDNMDVVAKFQSYNCAELILNEILNNKNDLFYNNNFLELLAAGLVFSAESMGRYNSSRPASGFEHKFYHSYNQLNNYKTDLTHGELVSVGTLISSYVQKNNFIKIKTAFKKIGLPTTKTELLKFNVTLDKIKKSIKNSVNIKKERYTVLEELGADKIIQAIDEIFRS